MVDELTCAPDGGDSAQGSTSCSGGSRNDKCFSARLMWRTGGKGEMYTYLPPSFKANDNVCTVKPQSECNPTYGASVGRGSYSFKPGAWTTIATRVLLNDAGKENGELELYAAGKSLFKVSGLVLRDSDAGRIRGMMFQTFFGGMSLLLSVSLPSNDSYVGSTSDWATPTDQKAYFADFSLAITKKL
jgi:hypothetical protein